MYLFFNLDKPKALIMAKNGTKIKAIRWVRPGQAKKAIEAGKSANKILKRFKSKFLYSWYKPYKKIGQPTKNSQPKTLINKAILQLMPGLVVL